MIEQPVKELLSQAGIASQGARTTPLQGGQTNSVHLVETSTGSFVARLYQWQHDSEELKRSIKEPYLHDLLMRRGVPVPEIIAVIDKPNQSGMLMRFVPGSLLGDLDLVGDDRDQAWFSSGEALRQAHEISFESTHGVIDGRDVRPVMDSFGTWQIENVLHHASQLNERFERKLPLESIRNVLDKCHGSLNSIHGRLLHNDPHPWNILIDPGAGYRISAWLDWEYAFVGDPNWDLTRMDLWRMKPLPTHESFWDGYGRHPTEPNRSVYEMSIYLWQAHAELAGEEAGPRHTRHEAIRYLSSFPRALERLQAMVS